MSDSSEGFYKQHIQHLLADIEGRLEKLRKNSNPTARGVVLGLEYVRGWLAGADAYTKELVDAFEKEQSKNEPD